MNVLASTTQNASLTRVAAQARLLQFASQALPTGAYAYSSGLESMLSLGLLTGEEQCASYLRSLMMSSVVYLELPVFLQIYDALQEGDLGTVSRSSRYLLASRETRELQEQEAQMARALARVLTELLSDHDASFSTPSTYSEGLARAAVSFGLERSEASVLLVYNWIEQQVSALCRLLPLGPIAGQKLLNSVLSDVPEVIARGAAVTSEDVGASSPTLALASCLHETQYCRIFRS